MADRAAVEVKGLRELVRALDDSEAKKNLRKHMKVANKETADWMVPRAKASAAGYHKAAAKLLAPTIRSRGLTYGAAIILGRKTKLGRAAAGWEFGSRRYRQFPSFRSARARGIDAGYGVGRAIRSNHHQIAKIAVDNIETMWAREVARPVNAASGSFL